MSKKIEDGVKGKTILITGGTGSFGSVMVKALLDLSPKEIIVFSRDELKQHEMRISLNSPLLRFIIGDVRDMDSLELALRGVDYVFNAAALKQVPTAEFFPIEAVKTNILGGFNVIRAALNQGVKKVIILSTDKAVYPINAMGMSKALLEKTMTAFAGDQQYFTKTSLSAVRYGNVMYSRGSVIPYFVDLIKEGKKPRVTNPSMTRFLLPLPDSVKLVLYALSEGKNGSLYVKKAPASDVGTLARALLKIFGKKEEYETIGIRAGEKIHETLISKEEWARTADLGEFFEIPPETKSLDYEKYFTKGEKSRHDEEGYTSENTQRLNIDQTADLLLTLPEIQTEIKNIKR